MQVAGNRNLEPRLGLKHRHSSIGCWYLNYQAECQPRVLIFSIKEKDLARPRLVLVPFGNLALLSLDSPLVLLCVFKN